MIYTLPLLESVDIKGKTVAVWTNLNTTVNGGAPEHNYIAKSTVQTISYLVNQNCKVIVMGSFGMPTSMTDDAFSLMDVRFAIGNLLAKPTKFVNITNSLNSIKFMNEGEILFLENLKFHKEEVSDIESDAELLSEHLIKLVDIFVIDTIDIDYKSNTLNYLMRKKPTYLGLNLKKEFESLKGLLSKSEGKSVLILGVETNYDLTSEEVKELVNKFEKVFTVVPEVDIPADKRIEDINELKSEIETSNLVVWTGELDKYSQDVLEYLTLSVGRSVNKILGGKKLVETLKYLKFKDKGINMISTSGNNFAKLLLGKEIVLH